jgi:hypothetical protein
VFEVVPTGFVLFGADDAAGERIEVLVVEEDGVLGGLVFAS